MKNPTWFSLFNLHLSTKHEPLSPSPSALASGSGYSTTKGFPNRSVKLTERQWRNTRPAANLRRNQMHAMSMVMSFIPSQFHDIPLLMSYYPVPSCEPSSFRSNHSFVVSFMSLSIQTHHQFASNWNRHVSSYLYPRRQGATRYPSKKQYIIMNNYI